MLFSSCHSEGSGARYGGGVHLRQIAPGVLLLVLLFASPLLPSVRAQDGAATDPPLFVPDWAGDFTALSANALIGGLTGGVAQKLRGGSFRDGFTRGALGGSISYGGKRLAAQSFAGAGLLGREVAAVGSSVIRNAGDGRGTLERIALPLGPVRLYLSQAPGERRAHLRVELMTLFWAAYAAATAELEWDASGSLSAGTPVFRAPDRLVRFAGDSTDTGGLALGGTILLSDFAGVNTRTTFAHERVHVLQYDQVFLTVTQPFEHWLLEALPGGSSVNRYVDISLAPLLVGALAPPFGEHDARPWELEANFLAR